MSAPPAAAAPFSQFLDPAYWQSLWHFDNMVTSPPRAAPFGATTVMMCLFFGTNFLLFGYFYWIKNASRALDSAVVEKKEKKEKELSKPFLGTVDCYANITTELMRTGLIMAMTYICEYMWIFPHSTKSYSRDLFLFVLILFFAYAIYTIKPIHDLSLLGREQTEEWKGWMQFIFLLYHYFHAEEVYNSVRVMITCYVWMTGFGNFSFFYMKQDFSVLRIVQMLWRLNFSVLLLMWTHDNTYILYYICPMHTFYFLMVYAVMYAFSSVNTTKWGIRLKLFAVAIIIYVIWDVNGGIFEKLFAFLGTDRVIGAGSGSVYEWYFRTSLDHWSTFLGMIFALNFPLAEQYFKVAKGPSLWIGAVLMGSAALYWIVYYFPLEKLEYNLTHSYMAIIPLTAYIFFRNITPSVRSGVSMSLHDLGKTTLETYLLQHHIWLSSNAKTLWTLTPGNPWINFALATLVFFATSKELYRLTMSLRGMILPDDRTIALRNGLGLAGLFAVCGVLAHILLALEAGAWAVALTCCVLAAAGLLVITRFAANGTDAAIYQQFQFRFIKCIGVVAALCIGALLLARDPVDAASGASTTATSATGKPLFLGNSATCLDSISKGQWAINPCVDSAAKTQAYCVTEQWSWVTSSAECPVHRYTSSALQSLFKNKRVVFMGDSIVRSAYHGFISAVEPVYEQNHSFAFKHQNMDYSATFSAGTTFSFRWLPFVANISAALADSKHSQADFLVVGASLWDALYHRDVGHFTKEVEKMTGKLGDTNSTRPVKVWLLPTTILDDRLLTDDKRKFMNEATIAQYRKALHQTPALRKAVHVLLDPSPASVVRESHSVDGVHYTEDVYQVVAQMLGNAYALQFPHLHAKSAVAKPYVPKTTGSMSFPGYGAVMLVLVFVMLFLMDSFLGIGYLSLVLMGKGYDWDAAYTPLHMKLAVPAGAAPVRVAKTQVDEETDGLLAGEKDPHGHQSA